MKRILLSIMAMTLLVSMNWGLNNNTVRNKNFKISIVKGNAWFHSFKILGLIKITTAPQIAIWIEDEAGNYLETLYLTGRMNKINREEALPYWAHKTAFYQNKNQFEIITGATPKGSTILDLKPANYNKNYRICAEVNSSFDYNANFPKVAKNHTKYNKTNGQPSLIFKSKLISSDETGNFALNEAGYSEANGKTGLLYTDIEKLTTARSIIKYLGVIISDK